MQVILTPVEWVGYSWKAEITEQDGKVFLKNHFHKRREALQWARRVAKIQHKKREHLSRKPEVIDLG